MGQAFAFIGWIFEWFGQFFPRWTTLENTHGAVKSVGSFRRGRGLRIVSCGPGLHWWWPATTKWETYPTTFQTDNLPSQTIETSDGQVVTIGGMISYRVGDIEKLLTQLHSPVMAIRTVTLPAIHRVTCGMAWDKLKEEQRRGTLNTKLRNAVKGRLADLGVEVDSVELTDMARVRAYRLINSNQNDMEG